jgi:hypothetical protein
VLALIGSLTFLVNAIAHAAIAQPEKPFARPQNASVDAPRAICADRPMIKTGHCHCGDVTWAYSGDETWACRCHCSDCRRNCAAPMVSFIGVPLDQFEWTGTTPKIWASSPGVQRHFCGRCGTPMAFQAAQYPGEIHFYAASLTKPAAFEPAFHVHYEERLPWVHINDDLPKHPGSPP